MTKILLLLADGFEEIEALGTADILRRLGLEVCLAGLNPEVITGAHGMKIIPDSGVNGLCGSDFAAVILPGGMPGAANLDADANVDRILREAADNSRLIAAICAAPYVLAKRGLLNGRVFTMYPGFEDELGGVSYTGNLSETSGNIVTGKGPGAVFAFARSIASALGLEEECKKLYQGMFID